MRIKFSVARHARKKKVLKRASGYYGDKSRRLRMATQQVDKSLVHAYTGRKDKKTSYRQLWITRINAAVREEGMSYSKFIAALNASNITLNRKMLSEMAIQDPLSFKKLVDIAKAAPQPKAKVAAVAAK